MRALPLRPALVPLALCLAFALGAATALAAPGLGAVRNPGELGVGSLLIRTAEGLREAPRIETDVEIRVAGMIARTRVTQRFTNPTADWVEGVYVFPLPPDSAVDALTMRIGERVIAGRVEERARAKRTYEQAKREGRKASLVEQERPNVFTTSIANLGPAETVEVTIEYQEDARYDRGRFQLRFPLVVAPRYVPGTPVASGFAGTGWAADTDEVPDASRITPPVTPPATRREDARRHPVTLRAEIDAGFALADVSSPSHPIAVRASRGDVYAVRLDDLEARADRDFVLEWTPGLGSAPGAALFRERWEGEDYLLLMVMPPRADAVRSARVSRETIIVIDTSGSMAGASILQARRAVRFALDTLRPEDAFNVIEFDSNMSRLFPRSQPASREAIARAHAWVESLEAEGGTEMLPALVAALRPGGESRAVRQVVFVTDGAVGNERALFSAIERDLGRSRLYTIGIGSAPNAHLMSKAAEFGRGTFTYVGRSDEITEKMSALFEKIESPILHDLRIDWGGAEVEAWPARLPDVYIGEPVVVAARLPANATQPTREPFPRVVLSGRRDGEAIRMELALGGGAIHTGVSRLWARRKVEALMDELQEGRGIEEVSQAVATLGVRHQLVTRWSSLVAVDVTPTAPVDVEADPRAIPSLLPAGWDFSKLFGAAGGGAGKPAPPSPPDLAAPPTRQAGVAVGQPRAQVRIGALPQGGTPATLLIALGAGCLGVGTGLLGWQARRRSVPGAGR